MEIDVYQLPVNGLLIYATKIANIKLEYLPSVGATYINPNTNKIAQVTHVIFDSSKSIIVVNSDTIDLPFK